MEPYKVMVVEDCNTTRKILALYLRAAGFRVLQAANGVDAVEKLSQESVDIIVTDLNMPQMDGLELVRWVREQDPGHRLPVLMLTTESDTVRKHMAERAGVDAFLTKPVSQDRLTSEIKRLCTMVRGGEACRIST